MRIIKKILIFNTAAVTILLLCFCMCFTQNLLFFNNYCYTKIECKTNNEHKTKIANCNNAEHYTKNEYYTNNECNNKIANYTNNECNNKIANYFNNECNNKIVGARIARHIIIKNSRIQNIKTSLINNNKKTSEQPKPHNTIPQLTPHNITPPPTPHNITLLTTPDTPPTTPDTTPDTTPTTPDTPPTNPDKNIKLNGEKIALIVAVGILGGGAFVALLLFMLIFPIINKLFGTKLPSIDMFEYDDDKKNSRGKTENKRKSQTEKVKVRREERYVKTVRIDKFYNPTADNIANSKNKSGEKNKK